MTAKCDNVQCAFILVVISSPLSPNINFEDNVDQLYFDLFSIISEIKKNDSSWLF